MSKKNTFVNRTKAAKRKRKARKFVSNLNQRPTEELLAMIALMKTQHEKSNSETVKKSLVQSIFYISQIIKERPVIQETE